MQKFIDAFIHAVETHNAESLPTAPRYRATENGVPAALRHMQAFNIFDKVNCIGTTVIDKPNNTVFLAMNVSQGSYETLMTVRMKAEEDLLTEVEIEIIRARADTGFWFAPQDMEKLKSLFDTVIPEEKRPTRETLEHLGKAVLDNAYDGSMFGREDTCLLMEAGGIVYENTGYARLINPHVDEAFPKEDIRVPIPIGIAPNRPSGRNIRILAINEELGLVVSSFDVDGVVTPYIVSDETSTCFVPYTMLDGHHRSLLPEFFEGKSTSREMLATGFTINIVKLSDNNVQLLMQNTSLRPYGGYTPWCSGAAEGLKY